MSRFREGRRVTVDGAFDSGDTPIQNGDYLVVTQAPAALALPDFTTIKATPKFAIAIDAATPITITSPVGSGGAGAFSVDGSSEVDLDVDAGSPVVVWYDDSVGDTEYLKVQRI